jgi:hypothetical protein
MPATRLGGTLTTGINPGVVHPLSSDSVYLERNDKKTDASSAWAAGPHSSRAIICPDSVGDPFLGSVDNVMVPNSLCSSAYIGDIRASFT